MITIEETRDISRPVGEVFDFVADFSTTAEWDPGVVAAHRLDEGDLGVGNTFAVTVSFAGRELPLEYETTAYEPNELVVLEVKSNRFDGVDTIRFEPIDDSSTRVHYRADFELKGFMKLIGPFLGGTFDRVGTKAMDGMKARLG